MCIIIDANAAHRMHSKDDAGSEILKWLLKGSGRLIVSTEILKELAKTQIRPVLTGLDRAGKIIRADDVKCEILKKYFKESNEVSSNDLHVLAAVVITACELVFTHDQPLHKDLKNRRLVPHHCSIYQTAQHKALLGNCKC